MSDPAARPEAAPHEEGPRPGASSRRTPGRPRAQPLAAQRQAVVDAARHQFADYGYHGATIDRIARESGIPRPTVYALYRGKDGVFAAVLDDAARRVVAGLVDALREPADDLRAFVRNAFAAVFSLFDTDRDAVAVLLNAEQTARLPTAGLASETRRRVLSDLTDITRRHWSAYGVDIGDAGEIMALMFFRMAAGVAKREAEDGDWNRDGLIDLLTAFTLGGLDRLWQQPDVLDAARRAVRAGPRATASRARR